LNVKCDVKFQKRQTKYKESDDGSQEAIQYQNCFTCFSLPDGPNWGCKQTLFSRKIADYKFEAQI